jgi:3-oxoacyl-[acyl-carrier protein] reductase
MVSQTPLGRLGQPTDIAPIAVFLASKDSSWLTGETLYAGGGLK